MALPAEANVHRCPRPPLTPPQARGNGDFPPFTGGYKEGRLGSRTAGLRITNRLRLLSALMLLAVPVSICSAVSQNELDSLIAHAPGFDAFPEVSAIVLRDYARIEVQPSGYAVRHYEFLCKITSGGGGTELDLESRTIGYDSTADRIIVEAARTRLRDGRWVDQEKDAFWVTAVYDAQGAMIFSLLRQLKDSLPHPTQGAALYLKYRIEAKPAVKAPSRGYAGGSVLFGGYAPCLDKRLTIEVSPPSRIQYELQNGAPAPLVSDSGGKVRYEWAVSDNPIIHYELGSIRLAELVPRVLWTTFPDWQTLGLYVAEPFWEKVDSSQAAVDGFLQITSPDLRGVAAMMNAASWVPRNMRELPPLAGSMNYRPHSADCVWQDRAGNVFDMAVLLAALLRAYGFGPVPVLVPGVRAPFSNLPVLEQFHHVILAVPVGDDTTWLDPSASFYPPGEIPYACTYGKGCMLLAGTPLLLDVPRGSPESRGARTEMHLNLADDGTLSGTIICLPQGDLAANARGLFKNQNDQKRDAYAQSATVRIKPESVVTSFSVTDPGDLSMPLKVTLGFTSPDYAVRKGDSLQVEMPSCPFDFGLSGLSASLPVVRYPVQLPPRRRVTTEISLALPEGYAVTCPPPLIVQNPYVFIEISAHQGVATLDWTSIVEIKADEVPVSDYPLLRDAVSILESPKNRLVFLTKK
jgi:hypothetical protein